MKAEIQKRLKQFGVNIIHIKANMNKSYEANYLGEQLIRSGLSPALNYGEAQGAESRKDYIHKLSIVLKELKESEVNLEIMIETSLCQSESMIKESLSECKELIAIITSTIQSLRKGL